MMHVLSMACAHIMLTSGAAGLGGATPSHHVTCCCKIYCDFAVLVCAQASLAAAAAEWAALRAQADLADSTFMPAISEHSRK